MADAGWINLPRPVALGLDISWAAIIPGVVACLIISIVTCLLNLIIPREEEEEVDNNDQ